MRHRIGQRPGTRSVGLTRYLATSSAPPGESVLRSRNDPFFSLSRSIVAQQISVHAAEAVWQKLIAHVGAMTPGAVASQTEDALHGCGLSRPKARYLLSLAEHFTEGALDQESWHRMDDDAVIERLVQMKGIGRWTAEMFLIFHLLRPDVLPVADIGIQKAIASHFNDGVRPGPDEMVAIAEPLATMAVCRFVVSLA